jgi:hypothetical protein
MNSKTCSCGKLVYDYGAILLKKLPVSQAPILKAECSSCHKEHLFVGDLSPADKKEWKELLIRKDLERFSYSIH